MNRIVALSLISLSVLGACKKKQPETGVTPTSGGANAPGETCDAACRARNAAAEKARADSIAAANARAEADARLRATATIRATLAQKVYFDYDAAELSSEARGVLDAKLGILLANPGLRLRVTGHADERGSDEYNLALGQKRAVAVKRYLGDRGIDGSRIEVLSLGEERPEVTDGTEESFRLNRRAEFEIVAGGDTLMPAK